MANIGKNALKAKIDNNVYENDSQEITGEIMNEVLQDMVDTLADGGNIDDGSVPTSKIADGAVTESKIASEAVTENKIADDAVTTDKIALGAVGSDQLANQVVTTVKIADSAVSRRKLEADLVTDLFESGAVYLGRVTPNSPAPTVYRDSFVIATEVGTYTNFTSAFGNPLMINTPGIYAFVWRQFEANGWLAEEIVQDIGYKLMGVATPTTDPGTPSQKVFYIASEEGTYTNFSGVEIGENEVAILKWNGSWTKEIAGAATKDYVESIGKVIELFGIGYHWNVVSTTGWQVGYKMYNTDDKKIKTCGSVSESGGVVSWSDISTPRTDCIYIFGNHLYVWNGNDLIDVTFIAETGANFAEAIAKKIIGGVLTPVSVEDGVLNKAGNLQPSTGWKTRKYDIRNQDIVFISGRDTVNSVLAAQYDENDKVLRVFNPITAGESTDFVNVLIPVSNATYLKVSGRPDSMDSSCRTVFQDDIAQKQYVDEELEKRITKNELPNFSTQKTIDIEQGSLNNNGKIVSLQRIRSVDFIASDGQLVLNCNNGFGYRVYEYSSDSFNDFIQFNLYDNGGLNTFTPQSNTTYIRFVFLKSNGDGINVSEFSNIGFTINGVKQYSEDWNIASKQYVDSQFAEKILQGKTVVFLGDSITYGSQGSGDEQVTPEKVYHKIFANLTGCTNINLGAAGTCIANNTLNNSGQYRFVTRATQRNLQNADYIVVWGGTNDFSYDCKAIGDLFIEETITPDTYIGSKRKVPTTDTDSFAGALHDLIATIRSHNAIAPILFMTPLNRIRYSSGRPTSRETNQWGDWLDDFRDAIKKICAYYGIPVFDIGICSELDPQNSGIYSAYFADGIHPNASGHKIIGTLLYHWFKANMNY